MALEQKLEQHLVNEVRKHGGLCWKLTSPGTAGVPDRIIILPGGRIAFIETKAPGQQPRPIQVRRHNQLKQRGAHIYTIDHPNQIPHILHEIQTTRLPTSGH
ncbi:VRR-NUC domain-containing protein [Corynebacterium auriscanis]|uniref:Nuclease n=1 Tax=Corynebacterium auriscanis TaxID=99807 RepID=A0A0A2DG49_9CORY|nr:VRR-NUC domain-containing protein [Corynebacterium auriscanis]KGM18163.1 nuclease [Corynebacterium auriscanis]